MRATTPSSRRPTISMISEAVAGRGAEVIDVPPLLRDQRLPARFAPPAPAILVRSRQSRISKKQWLFVLFLRYCASLPSIKAGEKPGLPAHQTGERKHGRDVADTPHRADHRRRRHRDRARRAFRALRLCRRYAERLVLGPLGTRRQRHLD